MLLLLLQSAASGTYTLAANVGAFTLTGQDANPEYGRRLSGDLGAFTLSGQNATLSKGRRLTGAVGTFTLSGQAANLEYGRRLGSDVGTFTLSGQAANLEYGRRLGSDVGTFTLSGQAANLRSTRRVVSAVGTFTLSGQAANLLRGRRLGSDVGTFTLSGQAANLRSTRRVVSAVGTFTFTGQPATLARGRRVVSNLGTFTLTGQAAGLLRSLLLGGDVGVFTLSGSPAGLLRFRFVLGGVGVFTFAGQPADLRAGTTYSLLSSVGTFLFVGQGAGLAPTRRPLNLVGGYGAWPAANQFGADWDFPLMDQFVQDRGDQVILETAIACPFCRKGDATASFNEKNSTEATNLRSLNCNSCHGDGFIYRNAQLITGLLTQVNAGNRQLLDVGLAFPGDCVFSPAFGAPDLHDMDKVTLCLTDVLNEGQVIQRNAAYLSNAKVRPTSLSPQEDRLWYPSDGCAVWCEDENNVVYDADVDFRLVDNKIIWIGKKPKDGVFYVLKYHYYPEWIVYASPLQRVDRGRDLKQRVVLRKKHVAFMNSTDKATPTMRQAEQLALTGRVKI